MLKVIKGKHLVANSKTSLHIRLSLPHIFFFFMIFNREVTENYVIQRKIWAYLGTWQRSYKLVFIPVIYH